MKTRSWLAAIAVACVMLCACYQPAFAADVTYAQSAAEFSPWPTTRDAAKADALPTIPGATLGPNDSGWYILAGSGSTSQCAVLVDAQPTGFMQCQFRLSALCGKDGATYSRGAAQLDQPFATPQLLALYTAPSLTPTGYIEIQSLSSGSAGSVASIGLNAPASAWGKAAAFTGEWCGATLVEPPAATNAHYARLCRQFGLYCGG